MIRVLFPTTTAVVVAFQLARDLSWTTFSHYLGTALLCGVVYVVDVLYRDYKALLSLGRAVCDLNLTDVEYEDYKQLLPRSSLNYFHRYLKRFTRRKLFCVLVHSKNSTIESPRAFAFTKFCSVCIHSLGSVAKQPKNIILYHEVGHLFVYQVRSGGLLVLVLGNTIPLLFLAIFYEISDTGILFAFVLIFVLDLFMIKWVNNKQREASADNFALACWFTDYCDGFSRQRLEATLRTHGQFFEEMPACLRVYCEKGPASGSAWRKRAFERSYERMNRIGALNKVNFGMEEATGYRDGYWREVFFRRHTFFGYVFGPQVVLLLLKWGAVIYFSFHIPDVDISREFFGLLGVCAAVAIVCACVTCFRIFLYSGVFVLKYPRESMSIGVIESNIDLNKVRCTRQSSAKPDVLHEFTVTIDRVSKRVTLLLQGINCAESRWVMTAGDAAKLSIELLEAGIKLNKVRRTRQSSAGRYQHHFDSVQRIGERTTVTKEYQESSRDKAEPDVLHEFTVTIDRVSKRITLVLQGVNGAESRWVMTVSDAAGLSNGLTEAGIKLMKDLLEA